MKVGHTAAMELFVVTMHPRKRVNDFKFDLYLYNVRVDVEIKIVPLIKIGGLAKDPCPAVCLTYLILPAAWCLQESDGPEIGHLQAA